MKAAIFDMDGLLIDSEPLWRVAEQQVFARVGLELTDTMCRQTMGLRTDEVVAYWHQRHPWDEPPPEQIEAAIIDRVEALIRQRGSALPGVYELLGDLADTGCRLALASSSPPVLIEAVLERLGIADRFELCCSAADERRGKPHPAVYLTTARRLGIAPRHCVALEDSMAGVRSARAAGMGVVAVPAAESLDDPRFAEADLVVGSLRELSPAVLASIEADPDRSSR